MTRKNKYQNMGLCMALLIMKLSIHVLLVPVYWQNYQSRFYKEVKIKDAMMGFCETQLERC